MPQLAAHLHAHCVGVLQQTLENLNYSWTLNNIFIYILLYIYLFIYAYWFRGSKGAGIACDCIDLCDLKKRQSE